MTTATRTTETQRMIIKITLTREVTNKVAYMDGYDLPAGQETYENYEVTLTRKDNNKSMRTYGKPGGFAFFATEDKYTKLPAGAYARIGDAYITKEYYDICMAMIAELDAEVKNAEFEAVEQEEIVKKEIEDKALDAEAREYAEQIKNGLCPKCGTYCYGDCTAN